MPAAVYIWLLHTGCQCWPSLAKRVPCRIHRRATRAWTFGTVIIASPCGTILGTGSCRHGERIAPILGMVQRVVPELPHFLVYDRACFALRHLRNTNNDDDLVRELGSREALERWRTKVALVVDRFHQAGHSKADVLCRWASVATVLRLRAPCDNYGWH